ncbi:MAG TPA: YjbQ family protein [Actinomycetota bacterium]|nr:YjbQ family protein [Actinomycetota bacterium]
MRTHQSECTVSTLAAPDFVDITDDVQASLADSGICDGHVTIFSRSPSSPLIANERESGLLEDIKAAMARLNGSLSDGRPIIGSTSLMLPAVEGKLRLGTWQRVLLVELSQAGPRSVIVQIVGE